ncbi:MAG: hypothetical protein ACFFDY_12170 [Candidatus Thorarchaeota archaeon]
MINEIINRTNVNPAKTYKNTIKYTLKMAFGNTSTPNANKNHEIIKRMTITNKILFFDKLFSPEINLMRNSLRYH